MMHHVAPKRAPHACSRTMRKTPASFDESGRRGTSVREVSTLEAGRMTVHDIESRSRWTALVVLCTGMLMIVLDVTVVNVALPSIRSDLGFSEAGLAWVVNAYLIAFGGLLLLAGRLGDLAGRKDVFLAGLAVFTVASAVCGLAQNQPMLVAARFVQGMGGALTSAVILGMIVTMFPEPRERAKAIGVYAFVASAGGAVGLLAGGVLTQAISWHWIFFVNLPIGAVTAAAAQRVITRDPGAGFAGGADACGAVLITAAMMLGVFTIVSPAAEDGWLAGRTLGLGAVSLCLLAGFVVRQLTARHPLMPLRVLTSRNVAGANLVQALSVAGMFGMFFLGSLYVRGILGYNPLETGLAFLPVTVVMGALSVRYADRLVMRFGARTALLAGLALVAAGLVLFTRAPVHGSYLSQVLPVMLLIGAGAGVAFPALMTLAMSGATQQDAGLASGLVNTTTQVGGALGLAVLATVSASHSKALIGSGESIPVSLTSGYHLAFWIAACLVAAAMIAAATMLTTGREPAAAVAAAAGRPARSASDERVPAGAHHS
jgi:EmrB/QacA subfamily drug resistance transporter